MRVRFLQDSGRTSGDHGAMDPRITLITLGVEDLQREQAFYEALGFGTPMSPDGEVAFFQAGPMVFGLWTALGGHGAPGVEIAHNVRSREEVDAVLAAAAAAGGEVRRPAEAMDWGGYSGAFADPEGYVWEVAHNPGWTLADDGSVTLPAR
jgi:predicted lactoylglutathione lyase